MLGSLTSLTDAKQLYHLYLEGGDCELALPIDELGEFIDYYWLLTISAPNLELEVIPDTAMDLVLSPEIPEFAALYFPVSEKFNISLHGPMQYCGVCFRAATVESLLGSNLNTLQALQSGAPIIEHLDIGELIPDIQNCSRLGILKDRFDRFWLNRLKTDNQHRSVNTTLSQSKLIEMLENALGNESIASVCESLSISERQFRRLSHELFGLSPKKIQNVLRLQTVMSELFACKPKQITDLYYDDSHRIREIKRLTGLTPQQIRLMAEKYNIR